MSEQDMPTDPSGHEGNLCHHFVTAPHDALGDECKAVETIDAVPGSATFLFANPVFLFRSLGFVSGSSIFVFPS